MTALAWLVPAALLLGALGLAGFLWSLKNNQYDDIEGASWRALDDDVLSKATSAQSVAQSRSSVPRKIEGDGNAQ
jgi:cbb3-type cytochrome oxidase maturation protein